MPDKLIGFTQSSYPAFPASDEDYKTHLRYVGTKLGQSFGICKFFSLF